MAKKEEKEIETSTEKVIKKEVKKTPKKTVLKKPAQKSKGGIAKFFGYFSESYQELRKVTWPTRKETTKYTIIILIISAISALYLGGVDYLATKGLNLLLGR